MREHWTVVVLSLAAAFAFALSSSLKHVSAGDAPQVELLQVSRLGAFLRATVTHRLWLAGMGCDVAGVGLQLLALHRGALAIVQPLLTSGLVFALILRSLHSHHHIGRRQVRWTIAMTASLAGFVVLTASAKTPGHDVDRLPAILAAVLGVLVAITCIEVGRRQQQRGRSAALMGVALGVIYAATAALLKSLSDVIASSPLHVVVTWQLYVLIVLGVLGVFLNQIAFQAGPITASLPAAATVDPLLSVAFGVLVYDEHIRRGPGGGALLIAIMATLGLAVIVLARSHDDDDEPSVP